MSGDPRRGPVGADTAVPDPLHTPKDTGIHGISGGDARSGWLHGEPRDRLQQQEEDDIRKAVNFPTSVTTVSHADPNIFEAAISNLVQSFKMRLTEHLH